MFSLVVIVDNSSGAYSVDGDLRYMVYRWGFSYLDYPLKVSISWIYLMSPYNWFCRFCAFHHLMSHSCSCVFVLTARFSIHALWFEFIDPTDMEMLRRRIYTEQKYSHVYTLSLSTGNIYMIHNNSSINEYKNTCRKMSVIIIDMKTGINKIIEIKHKDTHEWSQWWVSYVNPMKYLIVR